MPLLGLKSAINNILPGAHERSRKAAARSHGTLDEPRKEQHARWVTELPDELFLQVLANVSDLATYAAMRHTCKTWNQKLTYGGTIATQLSLRAPLRPVPGELSDQVQVMHSMALAEQAFMRGAVQRDLSGPKKNYWNIAHTRDFSLFSNGKSLELWSVHKPAAVRSWKHAARGSGGSVLGAVSADGTRTLVADYQKPITYYRLDGACIASDTRPVVEVTALAVSESGTRGAFARGSISSTLVVWDFDTNQTESLLPPFSVDRLVFSPNGRRLAAMSRDRLHLWDLDASHSRLFQHDGRVKTLAFAPSGNWLAVANERSMTLYDLRDSRPERTEQGWMGPTYGALAFSPDSDVFAYSQDDAIVIMSGLGQGEHKTQRLLTDLSYMYTRRIDFAPAGTTRFVMMSARGVEFFARGPNGDFQLARQLFDVDRLRRREGTLFSSDGRTLSTPVHEGVRDTDAKLPRKLPRLMFRQA